MPDSLQALLIIVGSIFLLSRVGSIWRYFAGRAALRNHFGAQDSSVADITRSNLFLGCDSASQAFWSSLTKQFYEVSLSENHAVSDRVLCAVTFFPFTGFVTRINTEAAE